MPITSSAKKALRQTAKRKTANIMRKDAYKKAVKEVRTLAAAKKTAEANAKLPSAFAALDKAAKTKAIKPNKASRLKSGLAHAIARSSKASS